MSNPLQCTSTVQNEAGDTGAITVSATPPVMYPPVGVSGPTTVDLRRSARSETRLQHTLEELANETLFVSEHDSDLRAGGPRTKRLSVILLVHGAAYPSIRVHG